MAENENTNKPTEIERRRQSIADRQKNRLEQAKMPGSTVFRPETPTVSFELMHYIRGIDRAMAVMSRNVFQTDNFKNIEQATKEADAVKKLMQETARNMAKLANINFEEFRSR